MDIQSADNSMSDVDILQSLEQMIKTNSSTLDKNRTELRKLKEMLASFFENDPTYQKHDAAAKDAAKIRQKTKSELLKQPAANELNQKIKALSTENKEMQLSMSDYLREYQRLSGSSEITDENGNTMQIVFVAKLTKPPKKFK